MPSARRWWRCCWRATVSDPARGPGSYPAPAAFELTLLVIAGLCVAGLLITLALPRRAATRNAVDPVLAKAGV